MQEGENQQQQQQQQQCCAFVFEHGFEYQIVPIRETERRRLVRILLSDAFALPGLACLCGSSRVGRGQS